MKTIKLFSIFLALLIGVLGLSACAPFAYDNTTILAKITHIEGQKVTMLVGEMEMDNPMQGNFSNMGNMPSFPNGEMPSFPEGMEDFPFANGDFPSGMSGMQMPNFDFSGEMGDMGEMFHEDCDTISLTLNADIVETLAVGNIVQITFGDNGSVQSLISLDEAMLGGEDFSNMQTTPISTGNYDS